MLVMNTPDATRNYLNALMDAAGDAISSAAGDHGIDARDNNAYILHGCIERQQRVIEQLGRMVIELQAKVASLDWAINPSVTDAQL